MKTMKQLTAWFSSFWGKSSSPSLNAREDALMKGLIEFERRVDDFNALVLKTKEQQDQQNEAKTREKAAWES